jgi:hypothetical protein
MSNSSSSSSGVGFFGLLTVLFIGLKLTNVITWSWWLVMLPMYGPVALGLVVVIIGIGIAVISSKQGD